MAEQEENKAFKVQDRRRFDAEGNRRSAEEEASRGARSAAPPAPPPPGPARDTAPRPGPAPQTAGPQGSRPGSAETGPSRRARLGGLEFAEFLLSIASNAAHLLGGDDQEFVPSRTDLVTAAQHIDILVMLGEKTRGNLEEDEAKLLESLLYDLQMRYLEISREQGR